jgi:RNA polymerase sigma-70 factor (family 1)
MALEEFHDPANFKSDQKEILEIETLSALIAGNEKAFTKIFDQYHHAVYRHILRFVKSPDLASDLTQDIFIKVWENRSKLKPGYSFKAFLFTLAKNHLLNVLKRLSKEESIKKEIYSHAVHFNNHNEDTLIFSDYNQFALLTIDKLPPQRKIIFKMFKDEGQDFHEIAKNLGISENTVRDHLAKATKFLRGYLKVYTGIHISIFSLILF